MSKKQIVRIAGIASAVIFAMGALFPFVSMEFFGTKMSKSLINTSDGIFFILDAVLFAVTMFLSEKISLYICAATAVILTIADTQSFFGSNTAELSDVVTKGFGFYCVIIGAVLMVASAVANIVVQRSNNIGHSENVKRSDTRKCPFCAETIKADAVLCRFCGSRLEPLPDSAPAQESSAEPHSDAPKSGGRRALTVILIIISAVIFVISTIGMIATISDQPQKPNTNSPSAESYYSEPYTEKVQPAETEVTTAATTTTPATTTTATTKATTTTTAATTPEPEEVIDTSHPYEAYFVQNDNYSSGAVDGAVPYIQLNSDGTFEFQCNMYMDVLKYTGTWEYMTSRWGINFVLNVTGCNRGNVSTTVQNTPIRETLIKSNSPRSNEHTHAAEFDTLRFNQRILRLSYYGDDEQVEFSYDGDSLFGMTFPNSRFDVSYFNILS